MFEAYKYYWQNAFKYRATSTRADFWWPVLVNFIIFVILYFLLAIAGFASVTSIMNGYNRGVGFLIFLLFVIAVFAIAIIIPGIAICVRRVRDTGLTGWTVLVFWLLSLIFTSNDNAVMETISSVIDIIFLVIQPVTSINKVGGVLTTTTMLRFYHCETIIKLKELVLKCSISSFNLIINLNYPL